MKMIYDDGIELLKKAQSGDKVAEFDLIEYIRTNHMNRMISRYLNKNRQADNDDVRQEFLIGVSIAIRNAKLDIGDPIMYIINNGVLRVRGYIRKQIIQGTIQVCGECGYKSRINNVNGKYVCKKCGSYKCETFELNDMDETTLNNITYEGFEEEKIMELEMKEFEETLTPGTNMHNLYQLLKSGIDRYNPSVRNYIKEIAKTWGGCSDQNVVQNLEKLRSKYKKFIDESTVINGCNNNAT